MVLGDEPMTYAIPVVDLEDVQLDAVRAGTEELGAIQVINHGVPEELSDDLGRRMARLLGRPRAEKAELASPHPYRGWRQWPDDFGRLELERFNVAQFDSVADARAAGVPQEYLGLYGHANVWPADDPGLREAASGYMRACLGLAGTLLARWTGGRLRPGRHRVVAGGTVTRRSTAVFVYPSLEVVVEPFGPFAADSDLGPVLVWDHVKDRVADYLETYGRPDQIAAWRDGRPYVAELAENSAGQ
jgi:isopenicillin N synthase-like dioxygenase